MPVKLGEGLSGMVLTRRDPVPVGEVAADEFAQGGHFTAEFLDEACFEVGIDPFVGQWRQARTDKVLIVMPYLAGDSGFVFAGPGEATGKTADGEVHEVGFGKARGIVPAGEDGGEARIDSEKFTE